MLPDKPSGKQPDQRWKLYGLLLILAVNLAWIGWGRSRKTVSASEVAGPVTKVSEAVSKSISNFESSDRTEAGYRTYELPQATVHVVSVPAWSDVSIAVADELKTVADFAREVAHESEGAIAILNAGFFDPNNGKTTSHLIQAGQNAGDPAANEGLTGNPKLQPLLPQIFNRSEFRVYDCPLVGMLHPYDITFHDVPAPEGCTIQSAVGAGPQLLPEDTSEVEAFKTYEDGELVRDAIGSMGPNARSAIALHPDGNLSLIMAAQRSDGARGLTLAELADFAKSIGATQLLNLDGGSSSSLYYDGQVHLARLNGEGNPIQRPVKSVIVVRQFRLSD